MNKQFLMILGFCLALLPQTVFAQADGEKLFNEKCTICHALEEQKMGPSVKGMNKEPVVLKAVITDGVDNAGPFPMPAFGGVLKPDQIDDLIRYLSNQR